MAGISAVPDNGEATFNEHLENSQYLEHASDRNSWSVHDGKSVKSPLVKFDGDLNDTAAIEIQDVPRSGVRRKSVSVNVFKGSENATYGHDEATRKHSRTTWLRARELLRRRMSKQSVNEYSSGLDCNDKSNIRLEKSTKTVCKEQFFQRNLAVKALPEDISQDNTITAVTRSFEINPTVREHWSVLKEAVVSGKIHGVEDDNEMSGLRRLSLVPRKGLDNTIDISGRPGHSGWPKIKTLIDKKILKKSSKNDVIDNYDDVRDGNDNVISVDENILGEAPNTQQIELCTHVDSAVQALPVEAVRKGEVVSVTRSFEYNRAWINACDMLRKEDRKQAGEDGSQEEKRGKSYLRSNPELNSNKSYTELKGKHERHSSSKKDAYCQTDLDFGDVFRQLVLTELTCKACRSKLEGRKTRKQIEYILLDKEVRLSEDVHENNKNEEVGYKENRKNPEANFFEGFVEESSDMRLVAKKFEDEVATTRFGKGNNEEIEGTFTNSRLEGKEDPSDTKETEMNCYKVGYSVDFEEGEEEEEEEDESNGISNDTRPKMHEREEFLNNRTLIPEHGIVNKTVDSNKEQNTRKWKENKKELEIPEVGILSANGGQVFASDHKTDELNAATDGHTGSKEELPNAEWMISSASVRRENSTKSVTSPHNAMAITAKIYDYEQPLLKQVQVVKVVRGIDTQPWVISYV